tara:strand:+ start:3647 stop:4090 length:444 start_codon:yes stop_codon:yes gene_type:complete
MAINYAKHEEEFYGVFKLTSGEEILGKAVITQDGDESLVFLQQPVSVHVIEKSMSQDGNKMARGIGFAKWQQLSDEDFYIIREKDILTVSSMTKECMFMYETYINGDDGTVQKKSSLEMNVDEHKSLGHRGKIDDARQKFEDIFKTS